LAGILLPDSSHLGSATVRGGQFASAIVAVLFNEDDADIYARAITEPLLFKGKDFTKTDLIAAE
jgi:uncharacterized protein with PIN domain